MENAYYMLLQQQHHQQQISSQQERERITDTDHQRAGRSDATGEYVFKIGENDVLLGRGTIANDHPGNIAFRALIRQKHGEYNSVAVRGDKMKLARQVVTIIQAKGRFLRRLDEGEVQMAGGDRGMEVYGVVNDEKLLLAKCKQAFRHKVRQSCFSDAVAVSTSSNTNDTTKKQVEEDDAKSPSNSVISTNKIPAQAPAKPTNVDSILIEQGRTTLDTARHPVRHALLREQQRGYDQFDVFQRYHQSGSAFAAPWQGPFCDDSAGLSLSTLYSSRFSLSREGLQTLPLHRSYLQLQQPRPNVANVLDAAIGLSASTRSSFSSQNQLSGYNNNHSTTTSIRQRLIMDLLITDGLLRDRTNAAW